MSGTHSLTLQELAELVQNGARFLRFPYCFSAIILTFRRAFLRFVRPHESGAETAWRAVGISALAGWWGFPWGIIFTPICLVRNALGGSDFTAEILVPLLGAERATQIMSAQQQVRRVGAGIWGLRALTILVFALPVLLVAGLICASQGPYRSVHQRFSTIKAHDDACKNDPGGRALKSAISKAYALSVDEKLESNNPVAGNLAAGILGALKSATPYAGAPKFTLAHTSKIGIWCDVSPVRCAVVICVREINKQATNADRNLLRDLVWTQVSTALLESAPESIPQSVVVVFSREHFHNSIDAGALRRQDDGKPAPPEMRLEELLDDQKVWHLFRPPSSK